MREILALLCADELRLREVKSPVQSHTALTHGNRTQCQDLWIWPAGLDPWGGSRETDEGCGAWSPHSWWPWINDSLPERQFSCLSNGEVRIIGNNDEDRDEHRAFIVLLYDT